MKKYRITVLASSLVLVLTLAALPAMAQTVNAGSDPFRTPGDGSTYATLTLPLGFLCANWGGTFTVVLKGVPVVTNPAGAFGNSDTIIERLQNAVFDSSGNAVTRIAVRALHFRAAPNLASPCGSWQVDVGLNGSQSQTAMNIQRTSASGGTFDADIKVLPVWTFTNVNDGTVKQLFSAENILLSSVPIGWRYSQCPGGITHTSSVLVDSDNDGVPDLPVPGTSNFAPGWTQTCVRLKPCRDKNVDPVKHCYQPAGKVNETDPDETPVDPKDPVGVEG